ncbi:hypothetical protein DWB61_03735 [Ancylomarina euxinus]|uniref:Uncharacterized protein n=1 Tax=Ancylomarina euxinus TaxID=2283627 RepID=A0A425Y6U4_9BACT|nr:hypothetical protein [Ancylomarina euxinus]MBI9035469.1 hypothetical protein [Bacteroidales bacterium]MCZ4693888.1 hypothetical protein [Ancylomarina euxinus]MUP14692.1 hypothetical protein [Ancylomarina euxinus]RRG24237.1 hypothetical protein DWB61_03735 [Ancylomarina euxinus]
MLGVIPAQAAVLVAKKGAEKYKDLDPNSKKAVNIGGLLLVGLTVFAGYKMINNMGNMFSFITGQKSREEAEKKEAAFKSQAKDDMLRIGQTPTLSDTRAKAIAQALLDAFEYPGTYEKQVYYNLKTLKNKADYALVSIKYGMPRGRALSAELYNEMSSSEMIITRQILEKIDVKI